MVTIMNVRNLIKIRKISLGLALLLLILFFGLLTACQTQDGAQTGAAVKQTEGAATQTVTGQTTNKADIAGEETSMKAEYHKITAEKAKERIGQEAVILLDVRTAEENREKRIPSSLLIPVDELAQRAPKELTDKKAEIIVYCRSGNRSRTAVELLVRMGYTAAYDLGGINSWPYDTESGK